MKPKHIACDLDGTLAHYDGWHGIEHIGSPISETVNRVRSALAAGHRVSIFTARVAPSKDDADMATLHVMNWCREHIGVDLEVTAIKYGWFDEFWDDKAVRVDKNRGVSVDADDSTLWAQTKERNRG